MARSLPVHRLPGSSRPRAFSLKSEIQAWWKVDAQRAREDTVSVALLPFLNLAVDPENQYLGDGLAAIFPTPSA